MEELARSFIFLVAFRAAIDRIAQDRRAEVFEVDADLMGAAGAGADQDKADRFIERKDFDLADRFLAPALEDGHLFPVDGVAANRSVECDVGWPAEADGEIGLFHLPRSKSVNELLMG